MGAGIARLRMPPRAAIPLAMLRFILLAGLVVALVAFVTRSPRLRLVLKALLAVLAAYAVLKLTGVIDALAPDRDGVL